MATGITKIADVIVPEIFASYTQGITEEKSRIVQSGAVVRDPGLDEKLAGGGLTFNAPSWDDLDNDAENVASDDETSTSTPNKIATQQEIAVRLTRNTSWSAMRLTGLLAGSDPLEAIQNRVGMYWMRRTQEAVKATMSGIFADNEAAPTGSDTHTQDDLTFDASGGSFVEGVTNFTAENLVDAKVTLGDSMDDLSMLMVHSTVYARMLKNDLIDFIRDSQGLQPILRFGGVTVIIDDGLPNPSAGIFHSWLFGAGAIRWGVTAHEMPTEIDREPAAGDGDGQDILHNRVVWSFHPAGHAFIASSPANGGPSNANTTNNLAHADSWSRRFPERKQIKIARLITRES